MDVAYSSALCWISSVGSIHSSRKSTYPFDALADSTIKPLHISPWDFTTEDRYILHDLSVLVLCYIHLRYIGGRHAPRRLVYHKSGRKPLNPFESTTSGRPTVWIFAGNLMSLHHLLVSCWRDYYPTLSTSRLILM